MIGKASDIKTHQIEVFHGAYTNSGPISAHINEWLQANPDVTIIDIKYNTLGLPDAEGEVSLEESVLIIYKEA